MRTLLVDNYDSYTFNLFQLIAAVNGAEPVVLVNDDPALRSLPAGSFDNVVISPGPGRPEHPRDLGFVADLLRDCELPVLGVCLGHQAVAWAAGARIVSAPQARHGHLSLVKHDEDDLFAGIPEEFVAVRYHSLCVAEPLPGTLTAIARAEDGVLAALRHAELPRWGVQFHPESIASEHGRQLLANFRDLTVLSRGLRSTDAPPAVRLAVAGSPSREGPSAPDGQMALDARAETGGLRAAARRARSPVTLAAVATVVTGCVAAERIFGELYGSSATCFWLDSSMVAPGLSRFSFLGDGSGPLAETLVYQVGAGSVEVTDAGGTRGEPGTAFDVLEDRLRRRPVEDAGLPFDFTGGYVGYFGYEMKADCGASPAHVAPTPDAAWIFAGRLVAVDHEAGTAHVLALHDGSGPLLADATEWVRRIARRISDLGLSGPAHDRDARPGERGAPIVNGGAPAGDQDAPAGDQLASAGDKDAAAGPTPEAFLVRDRDAYQADVAQCLRQLLAGESYEVNLTNRLHLPFAGDPRDKAEADLAFYRRLRRTNPAPYAALLRVAGVTVLSSSPERFLRIEPGGLVQSRPIKGTAPRDPDPVKDAWLAGELAASPKNRAENLMITDLLRNDLGRVCEIGSVTVERFASVESYATVHHLVSAIGGRLKAEVGPVECVRRCFPAGSMTGAPKLRTMEIIDRLETEARGIYSGALGYFALSGAADLSVVIRTGVSRDGTLTVGAGGAVVLGSSPAAEYEEMLLKAAAVLRAYRP